MKVKSLSRARLLDSQQPHGLQPTRLLSPWDFPGKSTGVGCPCLLLPDGLVVKNLPAVQQMQVWSLGQEDLLERGMATHSSILAWRIPRTEETGGLQSMGFKKSDTTE